MSLVTIIGDEIRLAKDQIRCLSVAKAAGAWPAQDSRITGVRHEDPTAGWIDRDSNRTCQTLRAETTQGSVITRVAREVRLTKHSVGDRIARVGLSRARVASKRAQEEHAN
jgi:hypothetical protein